jgi:hypothetical protein
LVYSGRVQTISGFGDQVFCRAHANSTSPVAKKNTIVVETILSVIVIRSIPRAEYSLFDCIVIRRYAFFFANIGSMIAFLSQYAGFSTPLIAGLRVVAVIVGVTATFLSSPLIRRIGAVRSGIWFLSWQTIFLLPIPITMFLPLSRTLQGGLLVGFVSISRLGLWGFDLSEQYLVQQVYPPL